MIIRKLSQVVQSTSTLYLTKWLVVISIVSTVIFLALSSASLSCKAVQKLGRLRGRKDVGYKHSKMVRNFSASSEEFPNLPDPCPPVRRTTGIEDVMCLEKPILSPAFKNPCWYDNDIFRCLPYFHLIGAPKSATSDLFNRLKLHPDIVPNDGLLDKETWFWSWLRFQPLVRDNSAELGMTIKEFTLQFNAEIIEAKMDANGYHPLITGHGDPMDFHNQFNWRMIPQNDPDAAEPIWTTPHAIRHINPGVKLILLLRNPIDRLYSHYYFDKYGTSPATFHNDVISSITRWRQCLQQRSTRACLYNDNLRRKMKTNNIIYASMYTLHLKDWLKVFPRDQFFTMRTEDYSTNMRTTLKQLFSFLNISLPPDSVMSHMESLLHFRETKTKRLAGPMNAETREMLVRFFKPFNKDLSAMLHDDRYIWNDTLYPS